MIVCKWSDKEWLKKDSPLDKGYDRLQVPSIAASEIEQAINTQVLQLALIGYKIPDFDSVEIWVNNTDDVTIAEARRWAISLGLVEQDFYL